MKSWRSMALACCVCLILGACGSSTPRTEDLVTRQEDLEAYYVLDVASTFDVFSRARQLCAAGRAVSDLNRCVQRALDGAVGGYQTTFRAAPGFDVAFRNVRSTVLVFPTLTEASHAHARISNPTIGSVNSEIVVSGGDFGDESVTLHSTGRDETGYFNSFRVVTRKGRCVAEIEVTGSAPLHEAELEAARSPALAKTLAAIVLRRIRESPAC